MWTIPLGIAIQRKPSHLIPTLEFAILNPHPNNQITIRAQAVSEVSEVSFVSANCGRRRIFAIMSRIASLFVVQRVRTSSTTAHQ